VDTWVSSEGVGGGREADGLVGSMTYRGRRMFKTIYVRLWPLNIKEQRGQSNFAKKQRDQGDNCRRHKGQGKAGQGRKQVRMSMGCGCECGCWCWCWCGAVCVLYCTLVGGQGGCRADCDRPLASSSQPGQFKTVCGERDNDVGLDIASGVGVKMVGVAQSSTSTSKHAMKQHGNRLGPLNVRLPFQTKPPSALRKTCCSV
jgi:hypothetical protein